MILSDTFLRYVQATLLMSFLCLVLWLGSLVGLVRSVKRSPTWLVVLTSVLVPVWIANVLRAKQRHSCPPFLFLASCSAFLIVTSIVLCIFSSTIVQTRFRVAQNGLLIALLACIILQLINVVILSMPSERPIFLEDWLNVFRADPQLRWYPDAGESFFSAVWNAQADMAFTTAQPLPPSPVGVTPLVISPSSPPRIPPPVPLSPFAEECLNEWTLFLQQHMPTHAANRNVMPPTGVFVLAAVFMVRPPTDSDDLVDAATTTLHSFSRLVNADPVWTHNHTDEAFRMILLTCFHDAGVAANVDVCRQLLDICTRSNVEATTEEGLHIIHTEVDCLVRIIVHGTLETIEMVREWLRTIPNRTIWARLVDTVWSAYNTSTTGSP